MSVSLCPRSECSFARETMLTLDLLESVSVQSANLSVFLFENLKASRKGIGNLEVIVVAALGSLVASGFRIIQRSLHLPNSRDDLLRIIDHVFLFACHNPHLIVQGFGQCREELSQCHSE